jgi:hypothetical protein
MILRTMQNFSLLRGARIALTFILMLFVLASGCINYLPGHMSTDSEVPGMADPENPYDFHEEDLLHAPAIPAADSAAIPVAGITPQKSDLVIEVLPIVTPDPYPVLHGTRINDTALYSRLDRISEFDKTYILRGNATGLLVNVVEGPLYIVFEVKPMFDCLASPSSCRGNMENPVQRPYMTITVRDNTTHEIIAKDGYAREFSSDTGSYQITVESEEGSSTSTPGPRYIIIYKEGTFHITLEGNYLDVSLRVATGASPTTQELVVSGAAPAPAPSTPEEEGWW